MRRSWTEEEIDQVRELLVANSFEEVARKVGRTPSSVKNLCSRVGIRSRELRCDLFSVTGLAAAIHVRKTEIVVWIEQGWLPKHTVGEQLLQVREAKREQAAYEAATGVDL
jgi:hypothetical protein